LGSVDGGLTHEPAVCSGRESESARPYCYPRCYQDTERPPVGGTGARGRYEVTEGRSRANHDAEHWIARGEREADARGRGGSPGFWDDGWQWIAEWSGPRFRHGLPSGRLPHQPCAAKHDRGGELEDEADEEVLVVQQARPQTEHEEHDAKDGGHSEVPR
jgi:hypothetical protein